MVNSGTQLSLLLDSFKVLKTSIPEFYTIIENEGSKLTRDFNDKNHAIAAPVMIIAGGATEMDHDTLNSCRDLLSGILNKFSGTVISGGTTAGIPGLTGTLKAELQSRGELKFRLRGYCPGQLPGSSDISGLYDELHRTDAADFSVLEICTYWSEIVLSGIRPEDVILLGINGGRIALLEYKVALELGAGVYLAEGSGRAADEVMQNSPGRKYPNLFRAIHL